MMLPAILTIAPTRTDERSYVRPCSGLLVLFTTALRSLDGMTLESQPRLVLIVRVPGRRKLPNDLTKQTKSQNH